MTRKLPYEDWREHRPTYFVEMRGSKSLRFNDGDDSAKENSHRACCSVNCCINRASGGCRTPPHANEGPRGGNRAIPEQHCLCCTPWLFCSAVVLAGLRRGRDDVGARGTLIRDVRPLRHQLPDILRSEPFQDSMPAPLMPA